MDEPTRHQWRRGRGHRLTASAEAVASQPLRLESIVQTQHLHHNRTLRRGRRRYRCGDASAAVSMCFCTSPFIPSGACAELHWGHDGARETLFVAVRVRGCHTARQRAGAPTIRILLERQWIACWTIRCFAAASANDGFQWTVDDQIHHSQGLHRRAAHEYAKLATTVHLLSPSISRSTLQRRLLRTARSSSAFTLCTRRLREALRATPSQSQRFHEQRVTPHCGSCCCGEPEGKQ